MAVSRRGVDADYLGTSAAALITADSNTDIMITGMTVANQDSSTSYYFSVYIVPSGGSAGNDNRIIPARVLGPGKTDPCLELDGLVLGPGESLQALAQTASKITAKLGYAIMVRESA